MQKFLKAKRVNETNIRELDQKIQMESYLREKREAILEDRKNHLGDLKLMAGGKIETEEDQKSCL